MLGEGLPQGGRGPGKHVKLVKLVLKLVGIHVKLVKLIKIKILLRDDFLIINSFTVLLD